MFHHNMFLLCSGYTNKQIQRDLCLHGTSSSKEIQEIHTCVCVCVCVCISHQRDFQTVINVVGKKSQVMEQKETRWGTRAQVVRRRLHLNCKLQDETQWVPEMPSRRQTRVQGDGGHRSIRQLLSVEGTPDLARASHPDQLAFSQQDGQNTACTWLRRCAARYYRQEAEPLGFGKFSGRSNTTQPLDGAIWHVQETETPWKVGKGAAPECRWGLFLCLTPPTLSSKSSSKSLPHSCEGWRTPEAPAQKEWLRNDKMWASWASQSLARLPEAKLHSFTG